MAGFKHSASTSYPAAEGCKASGMRILLIWLLSCAHHQTKHAAQESECSAEGTASGNADADIELSRPTASVLLTTSERNIVEQSM